MANSSEQTRSAEQRAYFPETQAIIDLLRDNPRHGFTCSHGDEEPAVGIYEVPRGCVALPDNQTQALCPQHRHTNGSFEGMHPVIDLSIDAKWSSHIGEQPDFYIAQDQQTGELRLAESTPA